MSYLYTDCHDKRWIAGFVFLLTLTVLPAVSTAFQNKSAKFKGIEASSNEYIRLVDAVSPAVVNLKVEGFGGPEQLGENSNALLARSVKSGSGVLVDSAGYIITNNHVVANAKSIQVFLPYRKEYDPEDKSILRPQGQVLDARIVGTDQETDVAVLKIDAGPQPYLEFGDSDDIRTGQLVFAFGSPLGLDNSVSMGIVSSTARQLRSEDPMIYIQTDAPINPGNSGGPLINGKGEIVGINTLNLTQSGGSEGLGFAAPSNIVEDVYKQIKENGRVKRGVIGAHVQTVDSRLARGLGMSMGYRVVVSDVKPGGPADRVGLRAGDIVKAMDGKFMENARQLNVNIYGKPIDSYINLTIVRDGEELTKRVKVEERDDRDVRFLDFVNPEKNFVERLGVLAVELNREIRDMLPMLRKSGGVLIAGSNGKAGVLGDPLKPGDIIYSADGEKISTFQDFKRIINEKPTGEVLVLYAEREGTLIYLSYEMD